MMASVKELIELVKAAQGPDRELDHALWLHFDETAQAKYDAGRIPLPWTWCLTSSIDAALALTERVLPGYRGNLQFGSAWDGGVYQPGKVGCTIHSPMSSGGGPLWKAFAPTLPLAILAALLSALSTKEG